ncbi:hypothetical protein [Moorena sp. SIO3E8]|nr:hypothetical protein [Moorena sp. SIO3E8]
MRSSSLTPDATQGRFTRPGVASPGTTPGTTNVIELTLTHSD